MELFKLKAISDRRIDRNEPDYGRICSRKSGIGTVIRRRESSISHPTTPPNHTTIPLDLNFSGESTSSYESGASMSKAENYTHMFTYKFIEASIEAVCRQLGGISWIDPKLKDLESR